MHKKTLKTIRGFNHIKHGFPKLGLKPTEVMQEMQYRGANARRAS